MARDNKLIQFLKGSSILVATNIILRAINFFLLPLYTKYLDPVELGISDIVITFTSFLFPLLVMGLDSAFSAFLWREDARISIKFLILYGLPCFLLLYSLALLIISDKIFFFVTKYNCLFRRHSYCVNTARSASFADAENQTECQFCRSIFQAPCWW